MTDLTTAVARCLASPHQMPTHVSSADEVDTKSYFKIDALIAAKRHGFDSSKVIFSNKLEWVADGGVPVLRQARFDRVSGKVVLFVDAMQALFPQDQFEQRALDVFTKCIAEVKRGAAQSLYVYRSLLNADELIVWAKSNGIKTTLLPDDMHVTVVYSRVAVDEAKAGRDDGEVIVGASSDKSGDRHVEQLGDQGAIVLRFKSAEISQRWQDFKDAGASWDYPDYNVTITYKGAGVDLKKIKPYLGKLVFGPEVFDTVKEVDHIAEKAFKDWNEEDHPRDEDGQWTFSGGGGGGEVSDPNLPMTPEEEAAQRIASARPENVSDYELTRVNYSIPFKEQQDRNPKVAFKSEAEYKTLGAALDDYKTSTSDGDSYTVNRTLRGLETMTPRIQQAVDNIDLAFNRTAAPIFDYATKQPKDGWLYRGINNTHALTLKVGDEYVDDGFISSTANQSFAQDWARYKGSGGTLVKITVPAGVKVVPLMDSSDQDEGEVLLNRGTRFTVTKVIGKNIEMTVI